MTQRELDYIYFMYRYSDYLKTAAVILTFILIALTVLVIYIRFKKSKKKLLAQNYMKVEVELLDLVYHTGMNRYQLKMVYAHPKDNKNRYYFTKLIKHDPVMSDEVTLSRKYTMYVHPKDPLAYYVDVSGCVYGYEDFYSYIGGKQ